MFAHFVRHAVTPERFIVVHCLIVDDIIGIQLFYQRLFEHLEQTYVQNHCALSLLGVNRLRTVEN